MTRMIQNLKKKTNNTWCKWIKTRKINEEQIKKIKLKNYRTRTGIWEFFNSDLNKIQWSQRCFIKKGCDKEANVKSARNGKGFAQTVLFLTKTRKIETGRRNKKGGIRAEDWKKNGFERGKWGKLLRRQSIFELHARHIVIQRHGDDLLHGADQAVLLAAVLNHKGVRLVGVKHDVVGCHYQHASHHALEEFEGK